MPIVEREEARRNEEYSGNAGRLNRLGVYMIARGYRMGVCLRAKCIPKMAVAKRRGLWLRSVNVPQDRALIMCRIYDQCARDQ